MKLNLSKFKLQSHDGKIAILKHPEGHEFRVAIHALSPQHRKELGAMHPITSEAYAEGGEAKPFHGYNPNKHSKAGGLSDSYREKYNREHGSHLQRPSKDKSNPRHKSFCARMKGVKGPTSKDGKLTPKGASLKRWNCSYAEGGEIEPQAEHEIECTCGAEHEAHETEAHEAAEHAKQPGGQHGGTPHMFAEGSDEIPYEQLIPEEQAATAPYGTAGIAQPTIAPQATIPAEPPTTEQAGKEAAAMGPISIAPEKATKADLGVTEAPPAAPEPSPLAAKAPTTPTGAPMQPTSEAGKTLIPPTTMEAYELQKAGIAGEAKVQADIAKAQYNYLTDAKGAIAAQNELMQQQQNAQKQIFEEVKSAIHDKNDGHIDPNRWYSSLDTGQKIQAAAALFFGGFGAALTHGPNYAAQHIDQMIRNDIDAQKTEMAHKENLLSANMRLYGDMSQAVRMTYLQKMGLEAENMQKLAAQFGGPMAQAKAQQLQGALMSQYIVPMFQDQVRSQLAQPGEGAPAGAERLDPRDPAVVIGQLERAGMVKPEKAKDALKEIERAQDTRRQTNAILKSFDAAVNATKGIGRVTAMVKEPREVLALQQELMPTIKDLEGTVRMAAMENLKHNLSPNQYDTEKDTAIRRQALRDYLQSKMSAPVAKSIGVDLEKFASSKVGMPAAAPQIKEGQTAVNAQGQRIIFRNNKWQPL